MFQAFPPLISDNQNSRHGDRARIRPDLVARGSGSRGTDFLKLHQNRKTVVVQLWPTAAGSLKRS